MFTKFLRNLSVFLVVGLGYSSTALAEDDENIEEVIVTGSYIARAVEEQSNPVDMFDRSEWEEQGSPQMIEIIRNNTAISGTLNQSEQYTGSGVATGLKNINIRGLGAERSLVLMNGKRMVVTGASVGRGGQYVVDVGAFPTIAMERIELLKNGGAVTYGTDAMAGVWNFITRDEFEGFEFQTNSAFVQESEGGDQNLGVIWGTANDSANLVVSFEYENRDRLNTHDHGQVDHRFGNWPIGVSSFGNPGTFTPANYDVANQVVDPACGKSWGSNGGTAILGTFNTWSGCGYSYMPFSNIIDPQKRLKFLTQTKFELSDDTEVYGEFLWSKLETLYQGSPSYPPTNPGANYFTFVPLTNPGLADLMSNGMTDDQSAAFTAAGGALWWGRSLAGEGPAAGFYREHHAMRLVGGVRGFLDFAPTNGLNYDLSVTYSEADSDVQGLDVLTERFDQAVNGVGGPNCPRVSESATSADNDAIRGDTSQGCFWFNPVGTGATAAPGSALYNMPMIREWFTGYSAGITENSYLVTDLVISGDLPIETSSGNVAFAVGAQHRYYESEYNPTGDNRVDGAQPSPFHFLGVSLYNYLETTNWAVFAEAAIPFFAVDLELGIRYEDYDADAITKPKVAGRWDINDFISMRASYEQVFRVPTIPSQPGTALELYAPLGEYLSIETPIPTNLDPEASDNFNIGVILAPVDGLTMTVDYYNMSLSGPFGRESATCACADKVTNTAGQINKIITELINGDDVDTDGIDVEVNYSTSIDSGLISAGANANYILSYDVSGELDATGAQTGGAYEAAGVWNIRASALPIEVRPMPAFKINAWLGWSNDVHNARIYARYIDAMDVAESSSGYGVAGLTEVDSMLTFDAHYSIELLDGALRLTGSALNLADERAPLAPVEAGYDAYTHNPLGRVFQLGLRYTL